MYWPGTACIKINSSQDVSAFRYKDVFVSVIIIIIIIINKDVQNEKSLKIDNNRARGGSKRNHDTRSHVNNMMSSSSLVPHSLFDHTQNLSPL